MKRLNPALFSSVKMDWATPQAFFDALDAEFHFTLDPCASAGNTKCGKFYTIADNGLEQDWAGERVFCNPGLTEGRYTTGYSSAGASPANPERRSCCLSPPGQIPVISTSSSTAGPVKSGLYADACASATARPRRRFPAWSSSFKRHPYGNFSESVAPDDGNSVAAGSRRIVMADSVPGISETKIPPERIKTNRLFVSLSRRLNLRKK